MGGFAIWMVAFAASFCCTSVTAHFPEPAGMCAS